MATATFETAKTLPPAPLPRDVQPTLCTLVDVPFDDPAWMFEPKLDGLRVLCYVRGRSIQLISRRGNDQAFQFPEIVAGLSRSAKKDALLDGEIVCLDDRGNSSFRLLQQRFHVQDPRTITDRQRKFPTYLYVFDLLYFDRFDIRNLALRDRRAMLEKVLRWSDRVRITESTAGKGIAMYRQMCRRKQEGIIGKRLDSPYVSARSRDWVKIKCVGRQEFVIGGFTDPQRSRVGLGALLVGFYDDDGKFTYAGKVGTGFTNEILLDLRKRLEKIEVSESPFEKGKPPRGPHVHWVGPQLVAEIGFAEWTQNDMLRQPRFEGLRMDKKAKEVRRERAKPTRREVHPKRTAKGNPKAAPRAKSASRRATRGVAATEISEVRGGLRAGAGAGAGASAGAGAGAGVPQVPQAIDGLRFSNVDKVMFSEKGYTKGDLLRYYLTVARLLLGHLKDRPVTLERLPDGVKEGAPRFWQKNTPEYYPKWIRRVNFPTDGKAVQYALVNDEATLMYLVNQGSLTFHTWLSRVADPDRPDYVIFDLDPGDLAFAELVKIAKQVKKELDGEKTKSFIKTSGKTGLHIMVPWKAHAGFDEARSWAGAIAGRVVQALPKIATMERMKAARRGRAYVDVMQNGKGKHVVPPYVLRATPGATVSMPLDWEEVNGRLNPGKFDLENALKRIAKWKKDPLQALLA